MFAEQLRFVIGDDTHAAAVNGQERMPAILLAIEAIELPPIRITEDGRIPREERGVVGGNTETITNRIAAVERPVRIELKLNEVPTVVLVDEPTESIVRTASQQAHSNLTGDRVEMRDVEDRAAVA